MEMRMKRFYKSTVCFLFVIVVALYTTVPALAVDIGFMDEHGAEGEALLEAYKEALEPIKNGDYPILEEKMETSSERIYNSYYEKITGKSQEEFSALSTYDKVLLASTFIEPYYINDLGQTYNNETEWTYATDKFLLMFSVCCNDDENMKSAYNSLMYWQYQYYQSSGAFYNFVEGKDTLDYIDDKYIEDMHKETEDTISSAVISSSPKSDTSSVSSERNIWDGLKDKVSTHILTIVLLFAFVTAGAVIAIRKKKVNAQNDEVQ